MSEESMKAKHETLTGIRLADTQARAIQTAPQVDIEMWDNTGITLLFLPEALVGVIGPPPDNYNFTPHIKAEAE